MGESQTGLMLDRDFFGDMLLAPHTAGLWLWCPASEPASCAACACPPTSAGCFTRCGSASYTHDSLENKPEQLVQLYNTTSHHFLSDHIH